MGETADVTFAQKSKDEDNLSCLSSSGRFPQSVMLWRARPSAGVGALCFSWSKFSRAIYQDIIGFHASVWWLMEMWIAYPFIRLASKIAWRINASCILSEQPGLPEHLCTANKHPLAPMQLSYCWSLPPTSSLVANCEFWDSFALSHNNKERNNISFWVIYHSACNWTTFLVKSLK